MKEKSNYTKTINWKQFYRNVFALVIPIAIQNLINVGVTATDVIMLGKVGEKVLSGASLAGQIQYIMTLIFTDDVQLRTSEHRSMYSYVRLSIDRCTATYV